jgi:hypothetical protein
MHTFKSSFSGISAFVNSRKIVTFIFFALILLIGIFIFRDYGFSADERIDYRTGLVNFKYLVQRFAPSALAGMPYLNELEDLANYQDRHYGVFFQMPASVIPHLLGYTDLRDIYFCRHLFTFLFFWAGLIAFYKVLKLRLQSRNFALLGTLMLFLSPRIFADSFFNSKDPVFLALVIASWYTLNHFRRNLNLKWAVLHAVACAAALDTRIMAMVLPGLTFLWLAHEFFYARVNRIRVKTITYGLIYIVFLGGFTILFWPYLWEKPLDHFLEVFHKLDRGWSFDVLYWGNFIPFNRLPWHYVPGWILVSTPVIYLLWCLVGITSFFRRLLRSPMTFLHSENGKQDVSTFLIFLLPLMVVIATKAVLYDGWRHVFFIYPPLLYFSILGLRAGWRWWQENQEKRRLRKTGWVIMVLTFLGFVRTAWLMISMHPHQNVYFSFLPPSYIEKSFDMDYWGLSYRKALEYILDHDERPLLLISTNVGSATNTIDLLRPEQRARIKFVSTQEAEYFITEYRWHREPYPYWEDIYRVKVNGLRILSVFRLR